MENDNIKDSINREYILNLVRIEPLTISELSKRLNVSRPTIYLHLKVLENKGLIKREKDIKKKGAPVTIFSVEKAVLKKDKEELISFLKIVKLEQPIEFRKLFSKLDNAYLNHGYLEAGLRGYFDRMIMLNSEGEKILKENETPK